MRLGTYQKQPHERGDGFKETSREGKERAPIAYRSRLGDVRAPTANIPPWRLRIDPAARHEALYPKKPDRGSTMPVNGIRLALGDGIPGGIPRQVPSLLDGAEKLPIVVQGRGREKKTTRAIRKTVMQARQANKSRIAVVDPGHTWLDFARAPRVKPGSPYGFMGQTSAFNRKRVAGEPAFAQEANVPADLIERMNSEREVGQATRNERLTVLYDPPLLSLSDAVRQTQALSNFRSGEQVPVGPVGGSLRRVGVSLAPRDPSVPVGPISSNGGRLGLGLGYVYPTDPKPALLVNPPSDWAAIVGGQAGNSIAQGGTSLGDAVRLTPAILQARKERADALGNLSLGELVRRTPELVKSDPFLLNWNRSGSSFGVRGSSNSGLENPASGGSVDPETAHAALLNSQGYPVYGGGPGGGGSASTSPINIGGSGSSLPMIAALAVAAFLLLKR